MAYRVEITVTAQIETDEILTWLKSRYAGENGLRWYRALYEAIESLGVFPLRCPLAPETELFAEEIRQLFYSRKPHQYRILFAIQEKTVLIVHIRHRRRLPSAS